jgi:superfamily II DNA or RNA helicase
MGEGDPALPRCQAAGVTATPIRSDGRGLGEHYQAMVQGPTAQQLTEQGFLAAAKVLAPPGFDSTGLRKRMGDFDPKESEQRVGTIMGDCLGHYRKHLPGQTAIAFCCSVAHAEAVAALVPVSRHRRGQYRRQHGCRATPGAVAGSRHWQAQGADQLRPHR